MNGTARGIVRHPTGDAPAVAAGRATRYLGTAETLLLADLISAETVYILESVYEAPRQQVADAVRSLIALGSG